jgi:4-hydroxybenzoate polyprenyltransferase
MLCDIDDIESDSITSTCTVPRFAGIGRTLATADVLACILTAGIIAGALAGLVRLEVAVVYSGLLLASLLVLNPLVPSGAWRNAMDLRLPMCVAGGWTIVILLTSRAPA